ncbi:MAG: RHS repeat-associated core domain-containing protein [Snowella sp.]|nr:RHS repeat-associated core domain-containing protein [Snowella sp.]
MTTTSQATNTSSTNGSIPAIRSFQFDSQALGKIKDSINLFRGDVNLPLNLVSLTGRNGLDVKVAIIYGSNVQNSINTWNLEAPTGVLGLGWSLGFDRIVADNNTISPSERRFYLMAGGSMNPLIRIGTASDGAYLYETQNYQFWRIAYYPDQERWEVTQETGITSIYGDKSSDRATVQWGVKWGNWIGSSASPLGQEQYAVAWNLSETVDTWDNRVVFEYVSDNQTVGNNGLAYTRAAYLAKVTDEFGRTIHFSYADKYGPNNPDIHGAIEYQLPHSAMGANAYQDRYETKYLDTIEVNSPTAERLFAVKFAYQLKNVSDTGNTSAVYSYLWKRYLVGIKFINVDNQSLPGIDLDYDGKADSTTPHPGTLKSITYPEGGKATYSYQKVQLTNAVKSLRINSPRPGSTPRIWHGAGYTVVAWYEANSGNLQLSTYSWNGRWLESDRVYFTAKFDLNTLTIIPQQDWLALSFQNQDSHRQELYLFRKNSLQFGQWETPVQKSLSLTSDTTATVLTSGDNFILAYNPTFSDRPCHGYYWDWKQQQWADVLLPSLAITPNTQVALTSKNNFYLICAYDKEAKLGSFQLVYQDDLGQWQTGYTWTNNFEVYQPSDASENVPFYWSLGDTFAILTYVKSSSSNPDQLTSEIRLFQWDAHYNILNPSSPLVKQYTSPIVDKNSGQDNDKKLQFPILASLVQNSMVGNSQHLLRYGSGGSSYNPTNWLEKIFDTSDTGADYQFGYGSDFAIMSAQSGNNTVNQLLQYDPTQNRWKDAITLQAKGHYPRGNGSYFNIDNAVYSFSTDGSWLLLGNLPGTLNPKTVKNYAPTYIAYEDTTGKNTTIVAIKNNQLQTTEVTNLYGERIYVEPDPKTQLELNLAGANTLVTYPADQTFDQTNSITLYSLADGKFTGIVEDFQVNYIEIEDGISEDVPFYQFYRYDLSNAIYDGNSGVAQYSKVTAFPGCKQEPIKAPYGRTEYYYSNGLSQQAGVFYPIGTVYNYVKILNGMLLCQKDYDADGKEVASSLNYWKVFQSRNQLGSDQVIPLYGVYTRLEKTVKTQDTLPQITENRYDRSTGLITETKNYSYDSKGQQTVNIQSTLYAWQVDAYRQAMVAKNLLSAIVQITNQYNKTVTFSYVTTWKNWGNENQWKWAAHQNYRLQQGTDQPTFNFSNPDPTTWLKLSEIQAVTPNQNQIIEQTDVLGRYQAALYDQGGNIAIATFSNASLQQVSYYGFESYEDPQGWLLSNGQTLATDTENTTSNLPYRFSGDAHTGDYCLKLPPSPEIGLQKTLSLPGGDRHDRYILSCWLKTETGFGQDTGSATWQIQFTQQGQAVGQPVTVEIPESLQWYYLWQVIDLTQLTFKREFPLEVSLLVTNQKATKYCLVDNLRFSPFLCDFTANVYREKDWLVTATLDKNGETMRQLYDDYSQPLANIGPAENVTALSTRYFSRGGNNDRFNLADPNHNLAIAVKGGGFYQTFTDNQWQDRWQTDNPDQWLIQNKALVYQGKQTGQITLQESKTDSDYGVMVKITPPATMTQAVGIRIGNLTVQWSPQAGQWQLLVSGNPTPVSTLSQETLPTTEWLAVVIEKGLLFYVGGRPIFSYLASQIITGPLTLFTGDAVQFQNLVVFHEPQLSLTYQDGSGRTRQTQTLAGNHLLVSESCYDAIGRLAIKTKPARYRDTLFGYQSDFVKGIAWDTTGILTGYVADYYTEQGEGDSDDQGYPYYRTCFEASPLSRQIEIGSPGKEFAITNLDTTQPTDRHTVKYSYGVNGSEGFASKLNLPAGQYSVTTTTDPDGNVSFSVTDPSGNQLAKSVEIDGANEAYIVTGFDYDYQQQGKVETVRLPNYYNPPTGSQAEKWVINSTYDFLGRLIHRITPDTTQPFQYIYDRAGQLRFMLDAEGAEKGYVLYTKYDELGRILEGGIYHQAWDLATLQGYANDEPNQPTANYTWGRKYVYDGDGTDMNALGRLVQVLVNKGDDSNTIAVQESYQYDIFGQVIAKYLQVNDYSDRAYRIGYTYDNLGNVTKVDYGELNGKAGPVVYYSYNALNQLTGIGSSPEQPQAYAAYQYNALGGLQQESFNHGDRPIERNFSYNAPGWLQQINNDIFQETLSYTTGGYSADGSDKGYYSGKIAQISSTFNLSNAGSFDSQFSYHYQYDRAGRLQTAQCCSDQQVAYPYSLGLSPQGAISYDDSGNILQLSHGNQTANDGGFAYQSYVYQPGTNQLQSLSIQTETGAIAENYTADGNGNITGVSGKFQSLTYDPLTQMTASITPTTGEAVTFTYGGRSQRVLKSQGDRQKLYIHGSNSYPLIELEKTGTGSEKVTFYFYGLNGLLAFTSDTSLASIQYVLKDRKGSTRAVVDSKTHQVLAAYNYLAFGDLMGEAYGQSDLAYLYTGQEYDAEIRLYNYRARFYDSRLGRFYGPDPAGQQPSPFAYCGNDPILFSDKTGRIFGIDDLFTAFIVCIIAGAVIGGVATGITYAVTTDHFTWGGFFENVGIGALTGAVSGAMAFGSTVAGLAVSGYVATATTASLTSTILAGTVTAAAVSAVGEAEVSVLGQLAMNAVDGKPLGAGLGMAAAIGAGVGFVTGGLAETLELFKGFTTLRNPGVGSERVYRFKTLQEIIEKRGEQATEETVSQVTLRPNYNTQEIKNILAEKSPPSSSKNNLFLTSEPAQDSIHQLSGQNMGNYQSNTSSSRLSDLLDKYAPTEQQRKAIFNI